MEGTKWIVVCGNPVDGCSFHGPFDNNAEAFDYAQGMQTDWWVAPLQSPEEPK